MPSHSLYDFVTLFFLTCMCLVIIVGTGIQIVHYFTRARHCTEKTVATLTQYAENISSMNGKSEHIAIFTYEHASYGLREFHRTLQPQNNPKEWPEIGKTINIKYDPNYPEKVYMDNELPQNIWLAINIFGCLITIALLVLLYMIYF